MPGDDKPKPKAEIVDDPPALVTEDAFEWPREPLAKGGMAVVYDAEDRHGRRAALKMLPANFAPTLRERLLKEQKWEMVARLGPGEMRELTVAELGELMDSAQL